MKKTHFIDRLLTDFRGQIIVCNILDGLHENLYKKSFVQDFFDFWLSLYANGEDQSFNNILHTMEQIIFDDTPKNFRPGVSLPCFRLICNGQPRSQDIDDTLATIVPCFILKDIMSVDDMKRLQKQFVEFPVDEYQPWSNAACKSLMDLPDKHRHFRLDVNRNIGKQGGLVWFTNSSKLEETLLNSEDCADQVRDYLGLIHVKPGDMMIELHYSRQVLKYIESGRPIFTDAGANRRFKTKPDKISKKKDSKCGYTVNLEKFAVNDPNIDGLAERVSHPVDREAMVDEPKIRFKPLGRIKFPRGDTVNDNDECFANRLLNGRDTSSIKREILSVL